MLQQTRVEAVIPYYLKWMKSFPTVQSLALSSEEEVNSHWAGLGFYRRARLLHNGAKYVLQKHDGTVPCTVDELLKIDGVGRYTASAIASIAFDVCVPVVDGNVCRVLSRLKGVANHIKAPVFKDDLGWRLAGQIVSAGDGSCAGEVNQALMELGATYCAPSGSGMDDKDPLKEFYMSTKLSAAIAKEKNKSLETMKEALLIQQTKKKQCKLCDPDGISTVLSTIEEHLNASNPEELSAFNIGAIGHKAFPIAPPKKQKCEEVLAIAAISTSTSSSKERRWLMIQRPPTGLLAKQWEFPAVCVWSSATAEKGSGKNARKGAYASTKTKGEVSVPFVRPKVRKTALDGFLEEVLSASIDEDDAAMTEENAVLLKSYAAANRTLIENKGGPLEHVFSHVRHTMWIEFASVKYEGDNLPTAWTCDRKRAVRWMSEADMKTVGVTSGVKKILAAVKAENQSIKAPKKRKR